MDEELGCGPRLIVVPELTVADGGAEVAGANPVNPKAEKSNTTIRPVTNHARAFIGQTCSVVLFQSHPPSDVVEGKGEATPPWTVTRSPSQRWFGGEEPECPGRGEWDWPDLNWRLGVPNPEGWTKLPHSPAFVHQGLRYLSVMKRSGPGAVFPTATCPAGELTERSRNRGRNPRQSRDRLSRGRTLGFALT